MFLPCFELILEKFREEIRDADGSDLGWGYVRRLAETKEQERKRLVEERLLEERRRNQQQRRGGGRGRGRGGGQGAFHGAGNGNQLICAWCQTAGWLSIYLFIYFIKPEEIFRMFLPPN